MKSRTMTLWRISRPLPAVTRWYLRVLWVFPIITFACVVVVVPHPVWFVAGWLLGAVALQWRQTAWKSMQRIAVAQVKSTVVRRRR